MIEFLSSYGEEYSEFLHYKLVSASRGREELKTLFDQYFEKEKNVLFLNPELLDMFIGKVNMLEYIQQLSLEDWINKINVIVQSASWETLWKLREVCKSYEGYEPALSELKIRCYEKILANKEIEKREFSVINGVVKDYVDVVLNFNSLIYREEVFDSELEFFLPDNCRFCNKLQVIYQEGLDNLAKIRIIREAVDLYPPLAAFCKVYVDKMQEETNEATNEFLQLARMIKQSIRSYISGGQ